MNLWKIAVYNEHDCYNEVMLRPPLAKFYYHIYLTKIFDENFVQDTCNFKMYIKNHFQILHRFFNQKFKSTGLIVSFYKER